jgi:hypothetical protein
MKFGGDRLKDDLDLLGHRAERVEDSQGNQFVVIAGYVVELGRFAGRTIDLAIPAPANYPQGVASAIHVKSAPHLLDLSDSVANVRNIVASSIGSEWRYWSKNFEWVGEKTTRRLLSQINEIFLHA